MTYIERLEYLQSRRMQLSIYYTDCDLPEAARVKLFARIKAIEAEITFIEDMRYKEAVMPLDTIKDLIIEKQINERE